MGSFFVCLGVCTEFDFSVFIKINGGPCNELPQRHCAGHAAIYGDLAEPKTVSYTMREIILFGGFL